MRAIAVVTALSLAASQANAQAFKAVWVAGPDDVWAAGQSGALLHSTAAGAMTLNSGVTTDLMSIWGSAPADIWIVGLGATILRWNGSAVTPVTSPSQHDWIAVTGCGPNEVYVLGQSEDDRQPPPLWKWNGSAWQQQQLGVAFRAVGFSGTCSAVQGAGLGGLSIAGAAYFDPRPTERRSAGVVARLAGGTWTAQGWNGQAITDPRIGAAGWQGFATNGGVTLLWGMDSLPVLQLVRGTAWTRLPAPPAEITRVLVTADGSPVLIFSDGFARLAAGQWRAVRASSGQQQAGGNQAEMDRIQRRMEALGNEIQRSGMPTQAQIQELQRLQMQYMAAQTGSSPNASMQDVMAAQQQQVQAATAQAVRNMALQFGEAPGVMAARTGSDFYVATSGSAIVRITGDVPRVVYSVACQTQPALCR